MNTVYLSIGSNLQPESNLVAAIKLLAEKTQVVAMSSVWETTPIGLINQPNFLNMAVMVQTHVTAPRLKYDILQLIERQLGRVHQKKGGCTIDLDIMLFNNEIFELGSRHIPNVEIFERAFIAITLAEIAPDYCHPETGQTLQEIAARWNLAEAGMWRREDVF
jgi:2-amino-4-hydroxy-6-hydroxymethyldihydropteridine diphosphokinase